MNLQRVPVSRGFLAFVLASLAATVASVGPAGAQTPGAPGTPPRSGEPKPPTGDEVDLDAPATPPGTSTTAAAEPTGIRLRNLEQRVQTLKEQAWRVKARVGMLKEAVLGGGIGARATVIHENKMGGSFRLVRLVYSLDGQQIFARADDSGKLHDLKNIDIVSGPLTPGNHTLSVIMQYKGYGYGVFSYLKGYTFTVRSSHTFAVSEGKQTQVSVIGYEKGGVTTPLEKRPNVEFKVTVIEDRSGAGATAAKRP